MSAALAQSAAGASALCALGLLTTGSVGAADWSMVASGRMATAYLDNPHFLQAGGASTSGAVAELGARVQRLTETLELSFEPRLRSARYEDDDSLDTDDRSLQAQLGYTTQRSHWSAAATLIRDSTLTSELGTTGLVQTNRPHRSAALSGGPSFTLGERLSIGAQGYLLDSRYSEHEGTALTDYRYASVSLFAKRAASERSDLSLTLQAGQLDPDQSARTADASLRLAWVFAPHALWTTTLSAGPAYVRTPFRHDTGVVFDADVQRRGERWTVSSALGRSLVPTGRGLLTRRDRIAIGWSYSAAENLTCSLSAQWQRNDDVAVFGSMPRRLEYQRLDAGIDWRFAEHWSLAVQLGAATQQYDDQAAGADAQRASLSLVWNGPRHHL